LATEYIIYADESLRDGQYYSNFYGGALVSAKDLTPANQALQATKTTQNLHGEIKWSKVTAQYLDKYVAVMDSFFEWVQQDKIKVRIMFTHNRNIPQGLTVEQRESSYHRLYYQFIKHAFGLRYIEATDPPVFLRIYLDRMPDTKEANAQFKSYLAGLQQSPEFRRAKIQIKADQIAEIDSHNHVILQCLDVVLGAMQFRLNDQHRQKREDSQRRGKRTVAKEKLYRHISTKIREVYPGFNVGISTGVQGDVRNRWHHPYRHWLFMPRNVKIDPAHNKP